jgi:hypothetical protein
VEHSTIDGRRQGKLERGRQEKPKGVREEKLEGGRQEKLRQLFGQGKLYDTEGRRKAEGRQEKPKDIFLSFFID